MLSVIEKVLPDAYELLLRRYQIMNIINRECPIGRRLLAEKVSLTERLIRSEVEILKAQRLVLTTSAGMELTPLGTEVLKKLDELLIETSSIHQLERDLAQYLNIAMCEIVPGNLNEDSKVRAMMAEQTIKVMDRLLENGKQIITVMGGTTLNEVANHMDESLSENRELLFVPARGGLGDHAMIEANVIAQRMAQQTGGEFHGLYAPEHVHTRIYEELLNEPDIKNTMQLIESASLILYSVGNPIEMAKRRGLDNETLELLIEKEAVAEAFGEFINKDGEVVYKLSNIGLQSSSLEKIEHKVTVAGGKEKAEAIEAYLKTAPSHTWLITDEAAAKEILNGGNPLK